MSKESEFFLYLIEKYASYKNTTANYVLELWDQYGITDFIYSMYEMYHIERLENAYDDMHRVLCQETSGTEERGRVD